MPWSMADFSAFRLSVGDSLLSTPMTSNFTPAGLLALNFSAKNCQLFSWLLPTGRHQARERIDPGDLDGLAGERLAAFERQTVPAGDESGASRSG